MTLKSINPEVPTQAPAAALLIVPNHSRKAGSTAVLEFMARIWPLTARRDELVYVFSRVGVRAPARDYGDVMKSPVYMPQHQLVLRSGAQDFQRCPSRGTRC